MYGSMPGNGDFMVASFRATESAGGSDLCLSCLELFLQPGVFLGRQSRFEGLRVVDQPVVAILRVDVVDQRLQSERDVFFGGIERDRNYGQWALVVAFPDA